MIGAALTLMQAASALPMPPPVAEWANLPPLRLERPWTPPPDIARFARDEVAAGRCAAPKGEDGRYQLRVNVAVLIGAGGALVRVVPAPMGCPTVEQFTAGLITRLAREGVAGPPPGSDTWLRASLTYSWAG